MKIKNRFWIPATMLALSSLFLVTNCTKDDDVAAETSIPVLTTNEVIEITQSTASSGGNITSDGGAAVTTRGVCWSTNQSPTIADSTTTDDIEAGSFTSAITNLTANTTYYVRAYATNSVGTGYGSAMAFTTLEGNSNGNIVFDPNITYGTMTDIDGNTYKTVTIDTQTWMAENLKVTIYNDGTSIPNISDATAWSELTTGALCDYENTPSNSATYGKLYNWYAVNTGKLCPTGWHVSTDAEWTQLTTYLGGEGVAGGKLKEIGATHWNSNIAATNETGFTALPGGCRISNGTFSYLHNYGFWWSATDYYAGYAWGSIIEHGIGIGNSNRNFSYKEVGRSVRCVRD